jgi:hypothetical protein
VWCFYVLLVIALVAVVVVFALANAAQPVTEIVLWDWGGHVALRDVSLAHAMLAAFAAGVAVMLVVLLVREAGRGRRLRRAEQRRRELEEELAAIRHLPFEEPLSRFLPPEA